MPQEQHFLQIPGPSPVPERVLTAMDRQVIDHRGSAFKTFGLKVLEGCKQTFKTSLNAAGSPGRGGAGLV